MPVTGRAHPLVRALWLLGVAFAICGMARTAMAHEARTARIEIDAGGETTARVSLVVPGKIRLELEPPEGCRFDPAPSPVGLLRCRIPRHQGSSSRKAKPHQPPRASAGTRRSRGG